MNDFQKELLPYLIICQQLRAQDSIVRIVGVLVGERAKCNGCDIRRADKWDLAIIAGRVYLALISDNESLRLLGKIL